MLRPARPLLVLLLLLLLPAPAVLADTIVVPGDFATFAEAFADPGTDGGDTIVLVDRITEAVSVPVGLDGLTIRGKGKRAILDAPQPSGEGESLVPLAIDSSFVTVRDLTIAHATGDALISTRVLTGTTISGVTILNGGGRGIVIEGDGTTVAGCTLKGLDGEPIVLVGDGALVTRNTIGQVAPGILVTGNDARVGRNTLASSTPGDSSILVVGDRALVDRNRIRFFHGSIRLSGADGVVERNRIEGVLDFAAVDVTGVGHRVSRNTIVGVASFYEGVNAFGSGMTVERNRIADTAEEGLQLLLDDSIVRDNKLVDCGWDGDGGLRLSGNDNRIEDNLVRGAHADGITISGDANLLEDNRVVGCTEDGVVVQAAASGTRLVGNLVKGNGSEGVENQGENTEMVKNVVKGNRIDLVNSGSLVLDENNKIGDGSDGSDPPEI